MASTRPEIYDECGARIHLLNNDLKVQIISVGEKATEICQEMYPEMLSELYKAKPYAPPNISLYWVDANDILMIRALIRQADFTYIVASLNDKEAVQAVSAAVQSEKDSFTVTAWLQSNDNHIEMPKTNTPCIELRPQDAGVPLWDICASNYIISWIGIDFTDISNAFKNYTDFSFVEIKGRKNAEEIILNEDVISICNAINANNNLQNVSFIMYLKKSCEFTYAEATFEKIMKLLPKHVNVLQNLWAIDDNMQEDDIVIRIYYGEHNSNG